MNSIVDFQQINSVNNQVRTRFDEELRTMFYYMNPEPRPCFNKICMTELHKNQSTLESMQGQLVVNGVIKKVDYLVLASDVPGIFNLGGDLYAFAELIRAKKRDALLTYAKLCVENVWTFYNMQAPITTIALVQGQAMGGGFESALAAHVIIAEKSAMMGLPEVLFNLFPGMGALSFLSRRVGLRTAEDMVRSGKVYSGEELYQMGVVDVLAEDGLGEVTLTHWIKKNQRSLNASQAITKAKHMINPLTYDELYKITEVWVDAALRLDERNLKVMERLVRAQNAKVSGEVSHIEQHQQKQIA